MDKIRAPQVLPCDVNKLSTGHHASSLTTHGVPSGLGKTATEALPLVSHTRSTLSSPPAAVSAPSRETAPLYMKSVVPGNAAGLLASSPSARTCLSPLVAIRRVVVPR